MDKTPDFFSQEAETLILSAMLMKEEILNYCCEILKPSDFYFIEHQVVFSEYLMFYKENINPDLTKLMTSLKNDKKFDYMGGIQKLTSIVCVGTQIYDIEDAEFYVKMIKNFSTLRSIDQFSKNLTQKLSHTGENQTEELVNFCQSSSDTIFSTKFGTIALPLSEIVSSVEKQIIDDYEVLRSSGVKPNRMGISTGYPKLDSFIGGLRNSHMIVLSARTGIGKTAFALNLALNCAFQDKSVLIYSLEMKSEEIVRRFLSSLSGIPSAAIADCTLDEDSLLRIKASSNQLRNLKIFCDENGGIKINEIISKSKRCKDKYKIDLIIIDYLQLIKGSKQTETRHLEIAEYTRSLKILAKELDVPIVVLAQLARRIEDRTGHKIFLSDMRESGAIEQDSDAVIAISRRDVYDKFDRPGRAQVCVLKNRHGPIGEFELEFNAELGKFTELQN